MVMMDPYVRRAAVRKVVDGDTLDLVVDVGFHLSATIRIRLLAAGGVGVDTPELRSKDPEERQRAKAAKVAVEKWCELWGRGREWPFIIRTEKDDSFGRWLAEVYNQNGDDLGGWLLDNRFAEVWR